MKDWIVAQARATYFFSTPQRVEAGTWQRLVGTAPDQTAVAKDASATEFGRHDGCTFQVQLQPTRVDVFAVPDAPVTANDLRLKLETFLSKANSALPAAVVRVAVGMVWEQPVQNQSEANAILGAKIGLQLAPGSEDVAFQINRPGKTESGTPVNRISKYSTARLIQVLIQAGLAVPGHVAEKTVVQYEIDTNTVPSWRAPDDVVALTRILFEGTLTHVS